MNATSWHKADWGIRLGVLILAAVAAMVLLGPLVMPFDGEAMSPDAILAAPSLAHPAGTDHLGRDVLVRTILGARSTLSLAIAATLLGVGAGTTIGMIAGYSGGLADTLLMRLGDAVMALPSLILAMLVMVAVGSGPATILIAIIAIFAPRAGRIIRAAVLNVVKLDFVAAAAATGESHRSILLREILPNIWPSILVEACLRFSYAILIISALGYLGIGVQPPTPDWGLMISEAAAYVTIAPWMIVGPAAAIVLSVISCNLIGDGVQEWIGARQRRMPSHV